MFPQDLVYGYYTLHKTQGDPNKLDYVIVEATAIHEDGGIVPGASVGATPELIQMADKVIVEVCNMTSYTCNNTIRLTQSYLHMRDCTI